MLTITPGTIPTSELHQYLLGAVAPRPICFASTMDLEGNPNLAPYSFFNVFSSNPPIAVFSSNRRVGNNTTKDTLSNVIATREVVINVVTYSIVRQMALCSIDYPHEVSEFDKAGFTPLDSELIRPFRVKESPVQMECKVNDIISLGESGGAGNLIVCEVLRMHIDEAVLDDQQRIDPNKIDLMARMGRAFYCRASGNAIHQIYQPFDKIGIGFDRLPPQIRHSRILTGNHLAQLAALTQLPTNEEIVAAAALPEVQDLLIRHAQYPAGLLDALHEYAMLLIDNKQAELAFAILMTQNV
ncbi:MAG: flavin reductase [Sphingobacteriales bacterium]|nr:MAG: flavin reductase [Sphingobacteriales bacterium]